MAAVVERVIEAPPARVFGVFSDGWTYSDWVVGSVHIRAVDPGWPRPGTNLHHKVGAWPLSLKDKSTVLSCEEPHEFTLSAGLWPLGAAVVHFRLTAIGDGATRVAMWEDFAEGPLRWVRVKINDLLLHHRNRETLRRLSDVATRRNRPD